MTVTDIELCCVCIIILLVADVLVDQTSALLSVHFNHWLLCSWHRNAVHFMLNILFWVV